MLDLKLLTFLAVVESGSYTAAANALHLTQPAVTQHIHKLETHYGCCFFMQEGRAMRLTEQGERFLHYVRLQQSNEKQLLEQLCGRQTPLRIGSTLSIADYYLPPLLLAALGEQLPLQVRVANTETLLGKLLHGELDAAFIEGIFDRTLFEAQMFCRARFLPVAAADHPLAGFTANLAALHRYPLILRERGSGTRAILENCLTQQNDSPASFAQIWEISSFGLLKRLLEGTQAVSFMYEAVAAQEIAQGRLTALSLEDCQVSHPLHFVCLKNSLERERIMRFYHACIGESESSST